ncbi:hypothetical protein GGF44_001982 [Coemansia sp. RSA 1694]|nr:hypothetical protein GGF44_001982 [Coemansia sp. RSA 1694]
MHQPPVFTDIVPMSAHEVPPSSLFAGLFSSAPMVQPVFGIDGTGAELGFATQPPATHFLASQANDSALHALNALLSASAVNAAATPPPDSSVPACTAAANSLLFGGGFPCVLPLATDFLPTLIPSPAMSAVDRFRVAPRTPDMHNNGAASEIVGSGSDGDIAHFTQYLNSHLWTSDSVGQHDQWHGQSDIDAGIPKLNEFSTATTSHDGRAETLYTLSSFREQLQQQTLALNLPTMDAAASAFMPHVSGSVGAFESQQTPSTSSKRRRVEGLAGSNISDVRNSLTASPSSAAGYALPASNAASVHRQQYTADDLRKTTTAAAGHQDTQRHKRPAVALWHGSDDHGYVRHGSESSDSQPSAGSPAAALYSCRRLNNKNQPRNTRSIRQRSIFYKWIIDHIDRPFPTDKERESLCVESMCKRDFNYWFSNLRHRSLECFVNEHGHKSYRPRLTFYRTSLRLGLSIPWEIPETIQCQLKHASPRAKPALL